MSPAVRHKASRTLQKLARLFGSKIRDAKTGKLLGKAFLITWRGELFILGYVGPPLVPMFLPQETLSYSRQAMGFTIHTEVDFERL